MEHGGSGATLRLGSGKDAMSIRARGRHRFGPSARPNDITLTRKNGAWFYAMLRTGTHYQDKSVDYEALSVARAMSRSLLNRAEVTAPWWGCYAAWRVASAVSFGERCARACSKVFIWSQPRNRRMRAAASLKALATHRSTMAPSLQRLTLRV